MAELTVGIEVEVLSQRIRIDPSTAAIDPCIVYFWDARSADYVRLPELNRKVIATNGLTDVTLEVKQSGLDPSALAESVSISRSPFAYGKLELITPREHTQNQRAFVESTNDVLFVLHHLYFFIGAPLLPDNKTQIRDVSYERDFHDFLRWYREYVETRGLARVHPALEMVKPEAVTATPDLRFRFPDRGRQGKIVPRFAPQLTFSGPLERIPALFLADAGTFHEPKPSATMRAPKTLEEGAAEIARDFVERVIEPRKGAPATTRKGQKLQGFVALVAYHVLHYVWKDLVDRKDARGSVKKDNFRFLVKSNLRTLYTDGLSRQDHQALAAAFGGERHGHVDSVALIEAVLEACERNVKSDPWLRGGQLAELARSSRVRSNKVRTWLESIFSGTRDRDAYATAIKTLVDEYTLLSQREEGVPRDEGVKLERPILEYRRVVGETQKAFKSAREVARAIEALYDKLRFLESEVSPGKTFVEGTRSRAYYQPLARLLPSDGDVAGLPKLVLTVPTGNEAIEDWWRTAVGV